MKRIRIGNAEVGEGCPTFIVAEMSANHGGEFEVAREVLHSAKRAGADAVKLQTYRADTITLKSDREDFRIAPESPWPLRAPPEPPRAHPELHRAS